MRMGCLKHSIGSSLDLLQASPCVSAYCRTALVRPKDEEPEILKESATGAVMSMRRFNHASHPLTKGLAKIINVMMRLIAPGLLVRRQKRGFELPIIGASLPRAANVRFLAITSMPPAPGSGLLLSVRANARTRPKSVLPQCRLWGNEMRTSIRRFAPRSISAHPTRVSYIPPGNRIEDVAERLSYPLEHQLIKTRVNHRSQFRPNPFSLP